MTLSTRKMTLLRSQAWMEIPFQHRGKTEFDCVIDTLLSEDIQMIRSETLDLNTSKWQIGHPNLGHERSADFKFARQSQIADFERMMRVLVNVRELVSACASDSGSKRQESLSTAIFSDSKYFMKQSSLPFNVGLQVTAAVSLVAQYASDSLQKQDAAQLYADWRGRFVLTD